MNPYYDEIVVGSSLSALMYATLNGLPLFFTEQERPFQFDLFSPEIDLSGFGIVNETTTWTSPEEPENYGIKKEVLWEHLMFLHSLDGLAPLSDMASSIRVVDNTLTAFTDYAKIISIDFGLCHYFDDRRIYNLLVDTQTERIWEVRDRIAFNRGGKHRLDFIDHKSDLIDRVWFYSSFRIEGKTPVKDACAVSFIPDDLIDDFDFSETMVRLEVLAKMKGYGLRGPRNGYQYDGKIRYRSFKTESISRTKFISSPPIWTPEKSIKPNLLTEEHLLGQLSEIQEAKQHILRHLCLSI